MNLAGSIYQYFPNYLDHVAPICSLLNIPIVVTEKKFDELIKKFYPDLQAVLHEDYIFYPRFLLSNYKTIISCQLLYSDPRCIALLNMHCRNYTLIWIPHGNSDKGHHTEIFRPLAKEKITLVYGQKMIDAFKVQKVEDKIGHKFIIGNYRRHYHLKHKLFYDRIIKKELGKLSSDKKTVLYAPTWEDYEDNGSYGDVISTLLENLPEKFNLIVKPHYNTYLKFPAKMARLHAIYEDHPSILFLEEFPSIYPLLDFADIYLGDMSSIGYDFLTFNKPMFFLNRNSKDKKGDPSLYLFKAGIEIKPNEYPKIYEVIEKNIRQDDKFSKVRREIASYTFGRLPDFAELKEELNKISAV